MELNYKYVELNPLEFYHYKNFLCEISRKSPPVKSLRYKELQFALKNENMKSWGELKCNNQDYKKENVHNLTNAEWISRKENKNDVINSSKFYYKCPCENCDVKLYDIEKKYASNLKVNFLNHIAFAHSNRKTDLEDCESYLINEEYVVYKINDSKLTKCSKTEAKNNLSNSEDFFKNFKNYYYFPSQFEADKCINKSNKDLSHLKPHQYTNKSLFELEDILQNELKNYNVTYSKDLLTYKNEIQELKKSIKDPIKQKSTNKTDFRNYHEYLIALTNKSQEILNLENNINTYFSQNEQNEDICLLVKQILSLRKKQLTNDKNKCNLYKNLCGVDETEINKIIDNNSKEGYERKQEFLNFMLNITNEYDENKEIKNKSMQEMAISYSLFFDLENLSINDDDELVNTKKSLFDGIDVKLNKKIEIEDTKGKIHKYEPDIYFEKEGKKFIIEIDGECHKAHYMKTHDKLEGYSKFTRKDSDVIRESLLIANGYYIIHLEDISYYIGKFYSETFSKESVLKNINKNQDKLNKIRNLINNIVNFFINGVNGYQSYLIYKNDTDDKSEFKIGGFKTYKDGDKYNLLVKTPNEKVTQSV